MANPREFAYVYMGTSSSEITDPPAKFCDELLKVDEELLAIEGNLAELSLGIGLFAQQSIGELEHEYVSLVTEIEEAQRAVATGEPSRFSRCASSWEPKSQNEFFEFAEFYISEIENLRQTSARVGQLINSKRGSANTRAVITISVVALLVSLFSLFL